MNRAMLSLAATALCASSHAHEAIYTVLDRHGVGGFRTLTALNDVDGDGVRDFAAGNLGSLATCAVFSGRTGATLVDLPDAEFVADAGDHDGDGAHDVLVRPRQSLFELELYSGATGALLRTYTFSTGGGVGDAAGLDDLDGDGVPEILVGLPQVRRSGNSILVYGPGRVDVISGADGAVLHADVGPANGSGYGGTVSAAGDLDADGVNDYLAGPFHAKFTTWVARALSGADGSLLAEHSIPPSWEPWVALAPLGDADGDGRDDYLLGSPGENLVRAISGASGADLWSSSWPYPPLDDLYGWSVAATDDWDGDGTPDAVVTCNQRVSPLVGGSTGPGSVDGPGFVRILSGRDGTPLSTAVGDSYVDELGPELAVLGDVDGDGRFDYVVSAPGGAALLSGAPNVRAPTSYCVANGAARIGYTGRPSVSGKSFSLTGTGLAPGNTVRFVAARQSSARGLPISPSWWPLLNRPFLCVGLPSFRLGSALVADAQGNVTLPLGSDFRSRLFEPGSTWSFQLAHRPNQGTEWSYSDGLRVTFEP